MNKAGLSQLRAMLEMILLMLGISSAVLVSYIFIGIAQKISEKTHRYKKYIIYKFIDKIVNNKNA